MFFDQGGKQKKTFLVEDNTSSSGLRKSRSEPKKGKLDQLLPMKTISADSLEPPHKKDDDQASFEAKIEQFHKQQIQKIAMENRRRRWTSLRDGTAAVGSAIVTTHNQKSDGYLPSSSSKDISTFLDGKPKIQKQKGGGDSWSFRDQFAETNQDLLKDEDQASFEAKMEQFHMERTWKIARETRRRRYASRSDGTAGVGSAIVTTHNQKSDGYLPSSSSKDISTFLDGKPKIQKQKGGGDSWSFRDQLAETNQGFLKDDDQASFEAKMEQFLRQHIQKMVRENRRRIWPTRSDGTSGVRSAIVTTHNQKSDGYLPSSSSKDISTFLDGKPKIQKQKGGGDSWSFRDQLAETNQGFLKDDDQASFEAKMEQFLRQHIQKMVRENRRRIWPTRSDGTSGVRSAIVTTHNQKSDGYLPSSSSKDISTFLDGKPKIQKQKGGGDSWSFRDQLAETNQGFLKDDDQASFEAKMEQFLRQHIQKMVRENRRRIWPTRSDGTSGVRSAIVTTHNQKSDGYLPSSSSKDISTFLDGKPKIQKQKGGGDSWSFRDQLAETNQGFLKDDDQASFEAKMEQFHMERTWKIARETRRRRYASRSDGTAGVGSATVTTHNQKSDGYLPSSCSKDISTSLDGKPKIQKQMGGGDSWSCRDQFAETNQDFLKDDDQASFEAKMEQFHMERTRKIARENRRRIWATRSDGTSGVRSSSKGTSTTMILDYGDEFALLCNQHNLRLSLSVEGPFVRFIKVFFCMIGLFIVHLVLLALHR